jgi:hypothetical protein
MEEGGVHVGGEALDQKEDERDDAKLFYCVGGRWGMG